jgi:tetratricopeptide (TPR) repeat protein
LKLTRIVIALVAIATVCGCAAAGKPRGAPAAATMPTTAAAVAGAASAASDDAHLTLAEIQPVPHLPTTQPSTRPAPLDAVVLYAKARDSMIQNQRYQAINQMEAALQLDPDSFELNNALGRAYAEIPNGVERSIAAFERAATIRPDDLEIQLQLGRAYQMRNDLDKAIERFRMARLTSGYRSDQTLAAVVDYRLAVALQQKGYDTAALGCYESLRDRVEHSLSPSRAAPELGFLLARPELLYDEIGKLHEKLGNDAEALRAYQQVAEQAPTAFEPQTRVVEMLIKMHRGKEASTLAEELVRRFRASPESIELLQDVHAKVGQGSFVESLRRLQRQHPEDRSLLFALAETLAQSDQVDQAADLLWKAIESSNGDVEITQRLYDIYASRDRTADAARLIIRVNAAHPDTTSELQTAFSDLLRLSRKNALRLSTLQKLDVPANAEAAKQYWVYRVASIWNRPATARTSLEAAADAKVPFDPAARAQIEAILSRAGKADETAQAANDYIEKVRARGRADLAAELRGLMLMQQENIPAAADALAEALRLTPPRTPSPDLQFAYALTLLRNGNPPRFEQLMWKLLSDRPHYDGGYQVLLSYYRDNNAETQAANVVSTWLNAEPNGVAPRLQQAIMLLQQRRLDEAMALVRRLFDQRPDDDDVIRALVELLDAAGQRQQAIDLLEEERAKHPSNRVAVEALVELYAKQEKIADATRVIDAARAAVADDPDLLYYVAHLYQRIDQPQMTEQVLQDVMKLDPTNAPAGNDLGYSWADEGKNLEQAESLIRIAVNAEPDNPSYLDSLGWVLYKRSQFEQASKLLTQAAEPADRADPVVLDHLGDVMYRLDHKTQARGAWQQSLERIERLVPTDENNKLRLQLQGKLRQADAGQTVDVAPVVENAKPEQARTQQTQRGG